jgi:stage V sporulation protein R
MGVPYDTRLPPDLRAIKEEIEAHARSYGLDFYEVIFEVLDSEDLNEVAAYGGFPTRYPHWTFGMAYEELKKSYTYGLSKIYEMVINNDPCYAYLMRCNHTVDQKLVMAHVYGHADFFKNNAYFAHTNRKMMDEMANHGMRIRRYAEKYGEEEVENFLDRCLSIEDLIDVHSPAIRRRDPTPRDLLKHEDEEEEQPRATRFKSKSYMDEYINPPQLLKKEEEEKRRQKEQAARSFPERPEKDVLLFLIEHAPLKPWQRDILAIIREEAYYFAPQAQTKILNEGWACVHPQSWVFTDQGLMRAGELAARRLPVQVSDGDRPQRVYDWACFPNRETVWLRTRRGLELEGSTTHQVLLANGRWRRLDDIQVGNRLRLAGGQGLWPTTPVPVPLPRLLGESKSIFQLSARAAAASGAADAAGATAVLAPPKTYRRQPAPRLPEVVDERLAALLGGLLGGRLRLQADGLRLALAEQEQARCLADLIEGLFGVAPAWNKAGTRWQLHLRCRQVMDLLIRLGLKPGPTCAQTVPEAILRSPQEVVAAFLRAYADSTGRISRSGLTLTAVGAEVSQLLQLLLLHFGILSHRRPRPTGGWRLDIAGHSAEVFLQQIGFGLPRKQEALKRYLERGGDAPETWDDEVVAIERRRATVCDFSVAQTHRYVAQGFINHNSYWHSTIMTERALQPWECIDYADHHSGTVATSRGRINPYKLGLELLRDIEYRWNTGRFGKEYEECDDLEVKRTWDKKLGLGRQKIFEVRRIHNDITFIDTFLTPEFCEQHKMFSYVFQEQTGNYVIESRDFEKIKQRLLFSLTNFGKPWIYVVDGNYRNRGELLLRHEYNGIGLKLDRAADTLANIQYLWGRPVHLQTVIDERPSLMSFDGSEHSTRTLGDADDPRKHSPGKTR